MTEIIHESKNRKDPLTIAIWGTGDIASRFMAFYNKYLESFFSISFFIDNNTSISGFENYKVLAFSKAIREQFDLLIVMNKYYKDICSQIEEMAPGILNKTLYYEDFIREIVDEDILGLKSDKVMYIGNNMMYEYAEYRALYTFEKVFYSENISEEIDFTKFDRIFLCSSRLANNVDRQTEEDELIRELESRSIERSKIDRFCEWKWLVEFDRNIGNGDKNPNEIFFVIGISDPIRGWGILLDRIARALSYARSQELIPVIDMKNMKNQYISSEEIGIRNPWDDFFMPLNEYDLGEVYRSKNVVLSGVDTHLTERPDVDNLILNSEMKREIEVLHAKLFPPKEKILGVIYRGTDYGNNYKGHPRKMDISQYILTVKAYLEELGYKYVFLATEEIEALDLFKLEFGERVIYINQLRYHSNERRFLATIKNQRENDAFLRGKEYLEVIYLLSECDSLIGQDTGTFCCAQMLNRGKYEKSIVL